MMLLSLCLKQEKWVKQRDWPCRKYYLSESEDLRFDA